MVARHAVEGRVGDVDVGRGPGRRHGGHRDHVSPAHSLDRGGRELLGPALDRARLGRDRAQEEDGMEGGVGRVRADRVAEVGGVGVAAELDLEPVHVGPTERHEELERGARSRPDLDARTHCVPRPSRAARLDLDRALAEVVPISTKIPALGHRRRPPCTAGLHAYAELAGLVAGVSGRRQREQRDQLQPGTPGSSPALLFFLSLPLMLHTAADRSRAGARRSRLSSHPSSTSGTEASAARTSSTPVTASRRAR